MLALIMLVQGSKTHSQTDLEPWVHTHEITMNNDKCNQESMIKALRWALITAMLDTLMDLTV